MGCRIRLRRTRYRVRRTRIHFSRIQLLGNCRSGPNTYPIRDTPPIWRVGASEVVAKKADSLSPVSGASIVAKVTRDRALRVWVLDETTENIHRSFGSGYPGDPQTKAWLDDHKHSIFGFPTLARFSWGTCMSYAKHIVSVLWEADNKDEDVSSETSCKRQLKLTNIGFITLKRKKSEEIESSDKGHCRFFQSRKLELLANF